MQYDETLPADEIDEDEEGVRAQKVLIDLASHQLTRHPPGVQSPGHGADATAGMK